LVVAAWVPGDTRLDKALTKGRHPLRVRHVHPALEADDVHWPFARKVLQIGKHLRLAEGLQQAGIGQVEHPASLLSHASARKLVVEQPDVTLIQATYKIHCRRRVVVRIAAHPGPLSLMREFTQNTQMAANFLEVVSQRLVPTNKVHHQAPTRQPSSEQRHVEKAE